MIIRGFLPETSLKDAVKVISEHCVPSNFNEDSVSRNGKTGVITITNLVPDQCLDLMEKMHSKKFLGRKIFVTSVVASSPSKSPPSTLQTSMDNSASSNTGNPVISEPSLVVCRPLTVC